MRLQITRYGGTISFSNSEKNYIGPNIGEPIVKINPKIDLKSFKV
jgi:hypothetical protein